MKHHYKVKVEQVITSQMAQQLKTKNINVIPELICCQCKAKFLLETEIDCIDDKDKIQSVTDTDNEFTECQTPRKKLNLSLQSISLHAVLQHSQMTNAKMKLD